MKWNKKHWYFTEVDYEENEISEGNCLDKEIHDCPGNEVDAIDPPVKNEPVKNQPIIA